MTDTAFRYEGSELALFAAADHWKRYYSSLLQPFIGPSVLEVGAGIGGTTQILCTSKHRRWMCLEPDKVLAHEIHEYIRFGKLPSCCEVRIGTLNSVPRNERFDTICYIDVLEHIEHDREEVALANQYLNSGGHLVILAPAHQWLFSPFDAAVGHFRRYSRKSLLSLRPVGMQPVLARYIDSIGLFASLANRLVLRNAIPTRGQINIWDSYMVPCSRLLDPVWGYNFGKTIVVVWERS